MNKVVLSSLILEETNPVHKMYFDCNRSQNGIFNKIDTSKEQSIGKILSNLVRSNEYEIPWYKLFKDVHQLFMEKKFDNKFKTMAIKAPEMMDEFIYNTFIHVGDSTNQKKSSPSLHRCWR